MNAEEQQALITAIGRFVKEKISPLKERITQLEHRLENQTYRGNWVEGVQYEEGNMVTLAGSCWIAKFATTDRPSTHSNQWGLMVKRGRDAPRRPTAVDAA